MSENLRSREVTLSHPPGQGQDPQARAPATWLSRRTPLVLLLIMILISLGIEAVWWPPMQWIVKTPILLLLLWGCAARDGALCVNPKRRAVDG